LLADPDEAAWADALYGAWLAGTCLGTVAMGIHHKICHALGGAFDLGHADVHCIMLPYTAAFNRNTTPDAIQRVARALDRDDAPSALYDLMLNVEGQPSLKALGLTRAALENTADLVMENPYGSPRQVTREDVFQVLLAAYDGKRP
jgi:alcohol dehydrogenase class IV